MVPLALPGAACRAIHQLASWVSDTYLSTSARGRASSHQIGEAESLRQGDESLRIIRRDLQTREPIAAKELAAVPQAARLVPLLAVNCACISELRVHQVQNRRGLTQNPAIIRESNAAWRGRRSDREAGRGCVVMICDSRAIARSGRTRAEGGERDRVNPPHDNKLF